MGLCKCPKKKVTNLFCYEHRVNVCEHCLVSSHEKCVVRSYLQWLQDSDFDPTCRLCGLNLSGDDSAKCVRLLCYDVFHWHCVDQYAQQKPANTAPAGYGCPSCGQGIFPGNNVASPVADALRSQLSTVNWARLGLGLPLLMENTISRQADPRLQYGVEDSRVNDQSNNVSAADSQLSYSSPPYNSFSSFSGKEQATPHARLSDKSDLATNPRRLFAETDISMPPLSSPDHDDDKYKRRPALQWLMRWFTSRSVKGRRDPKAGMKKVTVVLVVAAVALLTLLMFMATVGRNVAEHDPLLNPFANPNLRIQDRGDGANIFVVPDARADIVVNNPE